MKKLFDKIKHLFDRYERYFSPLALMTGFTIDSLTLRRIDLWAENLVILSYLFVAGLSIIYLNVFGAGRLKRNIFEFIAKAVPFLLQFAFGGLFSVFVVFYSRSASIIRSWPFLIVIVVLLVGNELFRKQYQRLAFQLSIYFLALFSYSVFALPVFLGKMGAGVFLL